MNARCMSTEQIIAQYETERACVDHEQLKRSRDAAMEAYAQRQENEKLALFTKRLMAGQPLRRAGDEWCAEMLMKTATPEALGALTALLKARRA